IPLPVRWRQTSSSVRNSFRDAGPCGSAAGCCRLLRPLPYVSFRLPRSPHVTFVTAVGREWSGAQGLPGDPIGERVAIGFGNAERPEAFRARLAIYRTILFHAATQLFSSGRGVLLGRISGAGA